MATKRKAQRKQKLYEVQFRSIYLTRKFEPWLSTERDREPRTARQMDAYVKAMLLTYPGNDFRIIEHRPVKVVKVMRANR